MHFCIQTTEWKNLGGIIDHKPEILKWGVGDKESPSPSQAANACPQKGEGQPEPAYTKEPGWESPGRDPSWCSPNAQSSPQPPALWNCIYLLGHAQVLPSFSDIPGLLHLELVWFLSFSHLSVLQTYSFLQFIICVHLGSVFLMILESKECIFFIFASLTLLYNDICFLNEIYFKLSLISHLKPIL